MRWIILTLCVATFVGCAEVKPLAYRPIEQPQGFYITADYAMVGTKMQVVVDTQSLTLEQALLIRADGRGLPPQTVQRPSGRRDFRISSGTQYIGGAHRTGMGLGVDAIASPAQLKTILWFSKKYIGQGPWKLKIKLKSQKLLVIDLPVDPTKMGEQ